MGITRTYCSCGVWHEFDHAKDSVKFEGEIPEYVECGECPECNGDLLDNIEKHADEAYRDENVNIEDLTINSDLDEIEDDIDEEFR